MKGQCSSLSGCSQGRMLQRIKGRREKQEQDDAAQGARVQLSPGSPDEACSGSPGCSLAQGARSKLSTGSLGAKLSPGSTGCSLAQGARGGEPGVQLSTGSLGAKLSPRVQLTELGPSHPSS